MTRRSKLLSVGAAGLGTAVYSLGQWLILVILTQATNPQYVGEFSLIMAIAAPVMVFSSLSLRQVFVTDTDLGYSFGDYFTLRLCSTSVAVILVALVCVSQSLPLHLCLWIIGAKAVDLVADILYGPFQSERKLAPIGLAQIINGVSGPVMLYILVQLDAPMWIATSAIMASSLLSLAYISLKTRRMPAAPRISLVGFNIGRLARIALPLGISALLVAVYANIPRYFIEHWHGLTELALFSAVSYIAIAGNALIGAVAQFALPTVAGALKADNRRRAFRLVAMFSVAFTALGAMAVAISIPFGSQLLTMLYGSDYADGHLLTISLVAWTLGAAAWMLEIPLVALRRFSLQMASSWLTILAVILASLILVPKYGALGGAWATVVGACVQLASRAGFLAWTTSIEPRLSERAFEAKRGD